MLGFDADGALPFGAIPEADQAAAAVTAVYLSTHGFRTAPTDAPAHTPFARRVTAALELRRAMIGGGSVGGAALPVGLIRFDNSDGTYDGLAASFAIDGRRVRVYMGGPDFAYADYGLIFDGAARGWQHGERDMAVELRDGSISLAGPVQASLYAGTGGAEGGDDLTGKPKPLAYGTVLNVSPPAIDTSNLVYQLHDGTINAVSAVYDRGAALAFDADYADYTALIGATISAGEYGTSKAAGMIRLGGSPAGQVTADFQGDASGTGWVWTTADVAQRMLTTAAGFTTGDLDLASFTGLLADNASVIGLYLDEPTTISEALTRLMAGVGGFFSFTRLGKLRVGQIQLATGSVVADLGERHVKRIERVALPSEVNPPNKRRSVAWQHNHTVQTSDLAGSVTDARRAFLAEADRVATSFSGATATKHLRATEPDLVPGLFNDEAGAQAEADRQLTLWSGERVLYRVRLGFAAFGVELNDKVRLTYPRFGLAGGVKFRVVGITDDASRNETELDLLA